MRILIAEDDDTVAKMLKEIFEEHGHTVSLARNGEIALRHLRHEQFEILVTDYRMPHIDGVQLIDQCRNDLKIPALKIFMFTSEYHDEKLKSVTSGADGVFNKAWELGSLVEAVNAVTLSPEDEIARLKYDLASMIESFDLCVGPQSNFSDMVKGCIRGYFIGTAALRKN